MTVTKAYVGVPAPNLSLSAEVGYATEGTYRWYVRGTDWWMVKDIPVDAESEWRAGVNHYVTRSYSGRVLRNTDFREEGGKLFFLDAHLDTKSGTADVGPAVGRRWNGSPIADMIDNMTDVRQASSSRGIEIDGKFNGQPLHLTVAPQYGYLATSLSLSPDKGRYGYTMSKVKQVGEAWMPEAMEAFGGEYKAGRLSLGWKGRVEFKDFSPHAAPTREEAPPIPPGAILGSEESRLYRMGQDGTLQDFGRQGTKPGTSFAWGDLFVLSGACLLLGSLSWLVFRKRRSSLSPLRGREGRG